MFFFSGKSSTLLNLTFKYLTLSAKIRPSVTFASDIHLVGKFQVNMNKSTELVLLFLNLVHFPKIGDNDVTPGGQIFKISKN